MSVGGVIECPVCGLKVASGTEECPIDGTPLLPEIERTMRRDMLIGAQLGEYVVKGPIGEGGMGVVYEGLQPVIGKRVAIKVLRKEIASDEHEAARLVTEARSVNAIGHRGIVDIFSLGTLPDGRQYLVMEFLVGISLHEHIRELAPLQISDSLQILDEILAALSAAHAAGVIHRDLKPNNVHLVTQLDGSRYVKLLDFGIAKQAPLKHGETPQTRVSRIVGTAEFMAPEQARGEPVGPRTDLYALGCVAFEMLTGRLPFEAPTGWEIVNQHLNTPAPHPSSFSSSVPAEVDALVLRLLAKLPADRPVSAESVRQEIKKIRRILQVSQTRLLSVAPVTPVQAADGKRTIGHGPSRQATVGMVQNETGAMVAVSPKEIAATASMRPSAETVVNVSATSLMRGPAPTMPAEVGPQAAPRTVGAAPFVATRETIIARPAAATVGPARSTEPALFDKPVPALNRFDPPGAEELPARIPRKLPGWTGALMALLGGFGGVVGIGIWALSSRVTPADPAPTTIAAPASEVKPPRDPEPTVAPSPAPSPAVIALAAPAPAPPKRPAPPAPVGPPAGQAALLSRIDGLRKGAASRLGASPSPVALMLLDDARAQATEAKTAGQVRAVSTYVDEWERKFSKEK